MSPSYDGHASTDRWPMLVQAHRSHDVANIYKWKMFVRHASCGIAAVDNVVPYIAGRLEKLIVAYPLDIVSFLWKVKVYGVFMAAIRRAK